MGFAFLESYWFEWRPKAKACRRCKGKQGAIIAQFSLNVNQPQSLKEPICPQCDRAWAERTYPPILWEKSGSFLKSGRKQGRKTAS